MATFRQMHMTCRMCGEDGHAAKMIKYGVRHYAHQDCYLDRRGLDGLHPWQVGHISWKALEARGLMDRAEEIIRSANR